MRGIEKVRDGWIMHQVLERWGLPATPTPDRQTLDRLHAAWLRHVPFENVVKLIDTQRLPPERWPRSPRRFWIDHFRWGSGGTCFDHAHVFADLLESAGFKPRFTFCRLPGKSEQSHVALLVTIEEGGGSDPDQVFLVDVGYALACPVALPRKRRTLLRTEFYDLEVRKGVEGEYLVVTEDSRGPSFRYSFRPRGLEWREVLAAWRSTYGPDGPYMRRLALGRFDGNGTRYIYKGPSSLFVLTREEQVLVRMNVENTERLSRLFGISEVLLREGARVARRRGVA